jgi:RNA polymerase sigma-70 factor (ECF subfamily)
MLNSSKKEIPSLGDLSVWKEMSFQEVLESHKKSVYYFIRRMVSSHEDADDITQDTFILVWKNLHQFQGNAQISTWIHRIAYRETLRWIKKTKKRQTLSMINTPASSAQQDVNEEQMLLWLEEGIHILPEKQKAVFIYRYFDDKKYEEISEITGTSIGALKANFHHASLKIEQFLQSKIMIP